MTTRLSDLIRNRRKARKLSTRALSRQVGVSSSYISELERGLIKRPSDEVLRNVFQILAIDTSILHDLGYDGVNVDDLEMQRYEAEDDSRGQLRSMYVMELSNRINAMSIEELERIYYFLDTCQEFVGKIWNLDNMCTTKDREVAMSSLYEFMDFLEHKYVDKDFLPR